MVATIAPPAPARREGRISYMDKSLAEIAELVGGKVVGDAAVRITGVNGLKQAKPGDLTFLDNPRYQPLGETTRASAILTSPDMLPSARIPLIHVNDPRQAFAMVLKACEREQVRHPSGIHPTAILGQNVRLGNDVALGAYVCVGDDCTIGDGAVLYAGVYVGHSCKIGENTIINPNVSIREGVTVGARCIIHTGVALGSDGFGFVPIEGRQFKIPQVGNLIVGDDVEIGANSAVDRATFGTTVIGRGTKIDNLVQIGHNVQIGEDCVVSGMSGIAGSAVIGDHVTIAGQAGINGHIVVGDGVTVGGRAGVTKSIEPGKIVSGFPAIDHDADQRMQAGGRRVPELLRRVRTLERRIEELENRLHGQAADDC